MPAVAAATGRPVAAVGAVSAACPVVSAGLVAISARSERTSSSGGGTLAAGRRGASRRGRAAVAATVATSAAPPLRCLFAAAAVPIAAVAVALWSVSAPFPPPYRMGRVPPPQRRGEAAPVWVSVGLDAQGTGAVADLPGRRPLLARRPVREWGIYLWRLQHPLRHCSVAPARRAAAARQPRTIHVGGSGIDGRYPV